MLEFIIFKCLYIAYFYLQIIINWGVTLINFESFSWIMIDYFLLSPCSLARYDTFQNLLGFYIISQTSLMPKARKTTSNNGSKLPHKWGNFDWWLILPHVTPWSKLPPNTLRKWDLAENLLFIFLFHCFWYIFITLYIIFGEKMSFIVIHCHCINFEKYNQIIIIIIIIIIIMKPLIKISG